MGGSPDRRLPETTMLPAGVNYDSRTGRYDVRTRCFQTGKRLRYTTRILEDAIAHRRAFDECLQAGMTFANGIRSKRSKKQIREAVIREQKESPLPKGIRFGDFGTRKAMFMVRWTTPIGRIESYCSTREMALLRLEQFKKISEEALRPPLICNAIEEVDTPENVEDVISQCPSFFLEYRN